MCYPAVMVFVTPTLSIFYYFWRISLVCASWHPQTISTVSNVSDVMVFMCSPRKRSLKLRKYPKWVEKCGNKYWNSKMHIWVHVYVCVCWCTFPFMLQPPLCAFKCNAPTYKYSNISSYFNQAARHPENSLSLFPSVPFTQANCFTENGLIEKNIVSIL